MITFIDLARMLYFFGDSMNKTSVESGIRGNIIKTNRLYTWSKRKLDNDAIKLGSGACNAGVFCNGGGGGTISHNIIRGRSSTTGTVSEAYGVSIYTTSPIISNNDIDPGHGSGIGDFTYGLYINGNATDTTPQITYNVINGGNGDYSYGIHITNKSHPFIDHNTGIDCGAGSSSARCINIDDNCNPAIQYNVLTNASTLNTMFGIYEVSSNPTTVNNNYFHFLCNSSQKLYRDNDASTKTLVSEPITTGDGNSAMSTWSNTQRLL